MAEHKVLGEEWASCYNTPPKYRSSEFDALLTLTPEAKAYFERQNTPESRLAFLLGYAHCLAESRFYDARDFDDSIIQAAVTRYKHLAPITTHLSVRKIVPLKEKLQSLSHRHRKPIREFLNRHALSKSEELQINDLAFSLAENQLGPERIFEALVEHCRDRHCLLPSFRYLDNLISQHYQRVQRQIHTRLEKSLTPEGEGILLGLIEMEPGDGLGLNELRNIDFGRKTKTLQGNAKILSFVNKMNDDFSEVINSIDLTDQAISYYTHWIKKTDNHQLSSLSVKQERCLRILAFLRYNHMERQDAHMEALISKFRSDKNRAKQEARNRLFSRNSDEIKNVRRTVDAAAQLVDLTRSISAVLTSADTDKRKLSSIEDLIDKIGQLDDVNSWASSVSNLVSEQNTDLPAWRIMAEEAGRLVRKFGSSVKALQLDPDAENATLLKAVCQYQKGEEIGSEFLTNQQRKWWRQLESDNNLLLLFMFDELIRSVRAGKISLLNSFQFKRLKRYLIDEGEFQKNKFRIINSTGLRQFSNFSKIKSKLSAELNEAFETVNAFLYSPENHGLEYDRRGRGVLKKKRVGFKSHSQAISDFLFDAGVLPISDILQDIDQAVPFLHLFHHSTNRYAVRRGNDLVLKAAIISQGCNLSARGLFTRSQGISERAMMDTISNRLTKQNLVKVNELLLENIGKLPLARIFQQKPNRIHSSSDGSKWLVKHDTLLAQRSFKYFGQELGLSRCSGVDEQGRAFCNKVFMPGKRESTYVLDILLAAGSEVPRTHSTDTHGVTEPVFACCYLMGIEFAPRIQGLPDQTLYGAKSPSYYRNLHYKIRPTRTIDWTCIESQWDNILHFMASILTGKCQPSQLFNRLNSYSGDHPLYKALKELGRVHKTLFILRYYLDEEMRDKIQKQLNIGEQHNRFQRAVCWGGGQRLRGRCDTEFEVSALATQLLQNAVLLWNYLYITQRLEAIEDTDARAEVVQRLCQGQMLAWAHVNFTGTFDFDSRRSPESGFDINRLAKVEIPHSPELLRGPWTMPELEGLQWA